MFKNRAKIGVWLGFGGMMVVKTGVFWSTRGPEAQGRLGEVLEERIATPVGDRDAEITYGALKRI